VLPPAAPSSLLNGLNASGAALRPGTGWPASDPSQQWITGRPVADFIRQFRPFRPRGVFTDPQPQQAVGGQLPGQPPPPQPAWFPGRRYPPQPQAFPEQLPPPRSFPRPAWGGDDDRDDERGRGRGKGNGKDDD
jgi:hypothetical protein